MRIVRPSVIVGIAVTAVLLAGCAGGQQQQSAAEQLVNAQGQTAGAGQAGGPDGTGSPTGSPDDASTSPSTSPSSDDGSSDEPTSDDSSGTAGHNESESPESHEASPSSSRTKSESASPRATSRPRPSTSSTRGGGGGGGTQEDRIKVSKCYTNATSTTGGQLLIKASSSDPDATLVAYTARGSRIGEVQNGGGSRYGGTVMPYQSKDPGACVIKSSSGGSISVPTTPFKL